MLGFGWCHLRSSRELFRAFRQWMSEQEDPWLQWTLFEALNNHHGLLTYSLSRNHRTSLVWTMLAWIRDHGPGSYGLFYCHDDEDTMDRGHYGRNPPMDFDNVYRVHRLKNGMLDELPDPFFGLIEGDLAPLHPYESVQNEEPREAP